eukprot:COSAG01_NODE_23413_length_816_cov_0.942817_1_plen_130_part_10
MTRWLLCGAAAGQRVGAQLLAPHDDDTAPVPSPNPILRQRHGVMATALIDSQSMRRPPLVRAVVLYAPVLCLLPSAYRSADTSSDCAQMSHIDRMSQWEEKRKRSLDMRRQERIKLEDTVATYGACLPAC